MVVRDLTSVVFACAGWVAVGQSYDNQLLAALRLKVRVTSIAFLKEGGARDLLVASGREVREPRPLSLVTGPAIGVNQPADHAYTCAHQWKALTPMPWLAYDRSLGHVRACDGSPGSQVMVVPSHVWYPPHRRLQTGDFLVERIVEQVTWGGGGRAIRVLS